MTCLRNVTLLMPSGFIENGALRWQGEHIVAAGPDSEVTCAAEDEVLDGGGNYLVPGFVDLQINGGFGADFTADPASIWQVGEQLPKYGVTAFLPTIVSSPFSVIEAARHTLQEGVPEHYHGAKPLGLHLEGPFLNPQKCGAHNSAHLRDPELTLVEDWLPNRGVHMATLAPELPGAHAMIEKLTSQEVLVAAGHSMASYAEGQAGLEAGIKYGTHLFNAMPSLDHREPGLVCALLDSPGAIVGLIADGIHLHPALIAMVYRLVGPDRISLVTDAMAGLGMPQGRYRLGEQDVNVGENSARLADGRLAGSVLSLSQAVKNFIQFTGCSLDEAIATVTCVPARLLNLDDRLGLIAPGYWADLTLLSKDLEVVATFVRGQLVFRMEGLAWSV